ncbi:MAG: hypothetical protein LKM34_08835 [Prevotella sp.]|jgi:hypothetical protein|nr:hypothetical protein [Prevotella sp.]
MLLISNGHWTVLSVIDERIEEKVNTIIYDNVYHLETEDELDNIRDEAISI